MPEFVIEPANMHAAKWKNIFRLFSWWYSSDKRVFVISNRWINGQGQLEYLELLEQNNELCKIIAYPEFFDQFQAGRLQSTSPSQDESQPRLGAAGAALWSDRG